MFGWGHVLTCSCETRFNFILCCLEDQCFDASCFDKIKRCGDRAKATAVPVDLWVGFMNAAEQREFVAEHMDSDWQFILDDSGVALVTWWRSLGVTVR